MHVLFVGSVPPPSTPSAQGLAQAAAAALEDGAQIDVLSPDPRSAAHLHASLAGFRLPIHLAVRSRRYDAVVLRIEKGVPFRDHVGPLERAAVLLFLGAVLSMWRDVTIRLDSPVPMPGGLGGRASTLFWRAARRVVVSNEADAAELRRVPYVGQLEIAVEETSIVDQQGSKPWTSLGEEPTRSAVLTVVRAHARSDDEKAAVRVELGYPRRDDVKPASIFGDGSTTAPTASGVLRIAVEKSLAIAGRVRAKIR